MALQLGALRDALLSVAAREDGQDGRGSHSVRRFSLMRVTANMMEAARRAEFDYHQRNRPLGPGRFIPTSDALIRSMLEAVLADIPDQPVSEPVDKARGLSMAPTRPAIVNAPKPRPAALLETEYPPTIEVGQVWFAKGEPSREILGLTGALVRYRFGGDTIRRTRAENFRLWIETWRASPKSNGEQ